ncbi:MAG: class I lanthipeptide [Bacteroidales bacterium]
MKKLNEQEDFSQILDLSKEDIASLNNEELNSLKGGVATRLLTCNCDTETTPACLTTDPTIPCI